jgi:hypothetical protein
MQEFIAKHQDKIAGTLSGFDRLVFRGHLRSMSHPQGMMSYLWTNQVLLKNFGDHVEKITERLKEASLAEAKACGRPAKYLNSSHIVTCLFTGVDFLKISKSPFSLGFRGLAGAMRLPMG